MTPCWKRAERVCFGALALYSVGRIAGIPLFDSDGLSTGKNLMDAAAKGGIDGGGEGKGIATVLLSIASFVVIVAGIKLSASLLSPILFAVFISVISAPAILWLETKKIPKVLAFLIVFGVVVGFLFGIGAIINSTVARFSEHLPYYQERLEENTKPLLKFLNDHHVPVSTTKMAEIFDPAFLMGQAGKMITNVGDLLSNAFLIFMTVAFILFEISSFPRKVASITGAYGGGDMTAAKEASKKINRYLAIKTMTSLSTGIIVAVGLGLMGVDFPMLWGLLAFLLNFIPTIGSIIAAVPPVLLAMVQFNLGMAAGVAALYTAVNMIIGNFLEPRFMGKGLGLSPLVVFLSLLFWGWLLGSIGMFLSVPLTMTVKIICDSRDDTKWVGVLLGP